MKFKTLLLFSLIILIAACSRNTKLPDDVNPIELTIVDSLESAEFGSITSMNIIDDRLFLVERGQHKFIIVDTETLEIVDSLGSAGQGPLEFKNPKSILELNNNVLVYDQGNSRFQVLDSELKLLNTFKTPLIWSIKKHNNTIYASTPGIMSGAKIFRLDEEGGTVDILALDPLFDKLKLKQFDRLFNFWIEKDEVMVTHDFSNKIYKLDLLGNYKELDNPLSKMKRNSLGGFQPFGNGFLLFSKYPVKENIFVDDYYVQSHLMHYENNELKQIYEIPKLIQLPFLEHWVVSGEFVYAFDSMSSTLYKLKITN